MFHSAKYVIIRNEYRHAIKFRKGIIKFVIVIKIGAAGNLWKPFDKGLGHVQDKEVKFLHAGRL